MVEHRGPRPNKMQSKYILFIVPHVNMIEIMPKFHYIYLAQNLLKTRFPTCFEQVSDMSQTSQRPKKVGDLVSDKMDLSRHVEIDLAGLRHVCDFFVESRF